MFTITWIDAGQLISVSTPNAAAVMSIYLGLDNPTVRVWTSYSKAPKLLEPIDALLGHTAAARIAYSY